MSSGWLRSPAVSPTGVHPSLTLLHGREDRSGVFRIDGFCTGLLGHNDAATVGSMSNGEGTKDLGGDEKRRPADRALFTETVRWTTAHLDYFTPLEQRPARGERKLALFPIDRSRCRRALSAFAIGSPRTGDRDPERGHVQ